MLAVLRLMTAIRKLSLELRKIHFACKPIYWPLTCTWMHCQPGISDHYNFSAKYFETHDIRFSDLLWPILLSGCSNYSGIFHVLLNICVLPCAGSKDRKSLYGGLWISTNSTYICMSWFFCVSSEVIQMCFWPWNLYCYWPSASIFYVWKHTSAWCICSIQIRLKDMVNQATFSVL